MADCTGFERKINSIYNKSRADDLSLFYLNLKKLIIMKKTIWVFAVLFAFLFSSCQIRVVDAHKPLRDNSLELYKKYTIQKNDASIVKVEVVKTDADNIYGKTKTGEIITIPKNEIREVDKLDLLSSLAIGAAAILAVIFVPI